LNVPATRTFALNLKAGACTLPLSKLAQLRFRLLKPVGHAHFAIHRHRGGEVFLSLPAIARAATERAKATVAMGDERAHPARLGECQRLAVMPFSMLAVAAMLKMGRDITQQVLRVG